MTMACFSAQIRYKLNHCSTHLWKSYVL